MQIQDVVVGALPRKFAAHGDRGLPHPARTAAAASDRLHGRAARPSMTLQRQDELEAKYGLAFTIIDRFYNRKAVVKPHV